MSHGWDHGLFGCFSNCGTCCYGCFCPCFVFGRGSYRLHHPGDPELKEYSSCNTDCCAYCALLALVGIGAAVLQCVRRPSVRRQVGVNGGFGRDCVATWCCHCCSLIQDDRELKAFNEHKGIYAQQPIAQAPMMYAPQ